MNVEGEIGMIAVSNRGRRMARGTAMSAWLCRTAALALALGAISCAPGPVTDNKEALRWASQTDLATIDPHGSTNGFVLGVLANVYEPLVRLDDDLKLEPSLATRWEMLSPTRWRFYLRRGVRFHDGGSFDADDVVFSLSRVAGKNSILRDRVGMIERVERVDDHVVDVITRRPTPILPHMWARLYMMDKQWAMRHGALAPASPTAGSESYASRHENGTGPYRIVDREQEVRTVFRRNDGWWGGRPAGAPREVILKPLANSGTRIAALLSSDVDLVSPLSIQDIDRIRQRSDLQPLIRPEMRIIFLGFDQFRAQGVGTDVRGNPFLDPRVRRAVKLAIDKQGLRDKLMSGATEPATTMIAPRLFPRAAEIAAAPFDPAGAKRLLAQAGYPNGFRTKFLCTNDRYVNDGLLCQAIVSMLARVGIRADLRTVPVNQYSKIIGRPSQDFGMYLMGWIPAGLDSYNILFNLMGSFDPKTGRGNLNFGAFSDAEIDRLTAEVESELDPARRDAAILRAYAIMDDRTLLLPLHTQPVIWAASRRFVIPQRGDDTFFFPNVRILR